MAFFENSTVFKEANKLIKLMQRSKHGEAVTGEFPLYPTRVKMPERIAQDNNMITASLLGGMVFRLLDILFSLLLPKKCGRYCLQLERGNYHI